MPAAPPLDKPIRDRIGRNIARLRGRTSQAQFAAGIGFSQSKLSRIETGSYPGLDIADLVAIALGAPANLDDLIDGCELVMPSIRHDYDRVA